MPEEKRVHQDPKLNKKSQISRSIPWIRLSIAVIFVIAILIIAMFSLRASLILAILSVVVGLLQWLLPTSQAKHSNTTPPLPPGTSVDQKKPSNITSSNLFPVITVGFVDTPPDTIFLFNEPLPKPDEFYGRVRERTTLISRARNGASTSIVGSRKIGKTWLMKYLELIVHEEFTYHANIGYIDASMPGCKNVAGFTTIALEKLGMPNTQARQGLTRLEKAIKSLRSRMAVPIICIDEFESFISKEFDLDFYRELRALTQLGLCLVVASKAPLIDIIGETGKTSGFFNVFEQVTLKPFDRGEADEFSQAKGKLAGFTDQERLRLLQYGQESTGYPPLKLQLAGKLLLDDKALAAKLGRQYYNPDNISYWEEFETRLIEKYQAVVR